MLYPKAQDGKIQTSRICQLGQQSHLGDVYGPHSRKACIGEVVKGSDVSSGGVCACEMLAYPKDARMHHFGPHPLITVEGVHIREPANHLELDQIMCMTRLVFSFLRRFKSDRDN